MRHRPLRVASHADKHRRVDSIIGAALGAQWPDLAAPSVWTRCVRSVSVDLSTTRHDARFAAGSARSALRPPPPR